MKYYIIAGEASGDLHGSNLIREIHHLDRAAEIRCWGGDLMQKAGASLVKHYRDLAFMGFVEVLANLRTIFRNIDYCKADITAFAPDCIIFIDYPGFNLRIAAWAKEAGYRTIYYISPQVWAWKENRVKAIRQHIDKMLVILPFEKPFYDKWEYPVEYVGHPLLEVIDRFRRENTSILPDEKLVVLLPGSRRQEILKKLPVMLSVTPDFPDYRFIVAKAPGQSDEFYAPLLAPYPNVGAASNSTYALLMQARAALVTSGTATLETALFGVPEVVCYKGNRLSYLIARQLIRVKYISLVNLIMDRLIVKELIQDDLNKENLVTELNRLLKDDGYRQHMMNDYSQLRAELHKGGKASEQAAKSIWSFLSGSTAEKQKADQHK
ncbi:lipid-A-disaccharide synthase [Flavihumibacter petaseus]|uniref:Lipid-A-disaccharide synthase n=1 Tax=Flavihumibacter petaseus NBRC 106054 TaxID=1220578 RepID=A0A0E9MUZ5_9BACT|nr:lipid-A-disaccharide synthase [Flavihumibacter petaseus]GAO41256.1 lipid A disaccharide synthase [Flavihumibacter petaseus NBRC 106054]